MQNPNVNLSTKIKYGPRPKKANSARPAMPKNMVCFPIVLLPGDPWKLSKPPRHYKNDHQRAPPRRDPRPQLAMIKWKLLRLDNLEGLASEKLPNPRPRRQVLNNYSLYASACTACSTPLKTLHAEQLRVSKRKVRTGGRGPSTISTKANLPWDPPAMSSFFQGSARQAVVVQSKVHNFMFHPHIYATPSCRTCATPKKCSKSTF